MPPITHEPIIKGTNRPERYSIIILQRITLESETGRLTTRVYFHGGEGRVRLVVGDYTPGELSAEVEREVAAEAWVPVGV